jgi:Amt family ammonium transporter
MRLDDVVGAIPVHLFAGVWGTLAVTLSNNDTTLTTQLVGILSVTIFTFVFSYIAFFLLKKFIGLRISDQAEKLGTDVAEIGVRAYAIRD